jgi:PKD repeat protein
MSIYFTSKYSLSDSNYLIKVVVRNLTAGCDTAFYRYITFSGAPPAQIVIPDTVICSGETTQVYTFTYSGISDNWNLGDGTANITYSSISHVFNAINNTLTFDTITLTTTNKEGCKNTAGRVIKINPAPNSGFTFKIINPSTVQFFADDISKGMHYSWNFGDGSYDSLKSSKNTYLDTGHFAASLTITNSIGCSGTTIQTVVIGNSGISLPDANQVSLDVFPNPSNGYFRVKYQLRNPVETRFSLLDLQGKIIAKLSPVQNQPPGVYTLDFNIPGYVSDGSYILQMQVKDAIINKDIVYRK